METFSDELKKSRKIYDNRFLNDEDMEPKLMLSKSQSGILGLCAKLVLGSDATQHRRQRTIQQVRLAIASHAMEWFTQVQGLSEDKYKLWNDLDEVTVYCEMLSNVKEPACDIDVRTLLVFASYLQLPLHVYDYDSKGPWRVEPWSRSSHVLEYDDMNPPKALAVAFLGYRFLRSKKDLQGKVEQVFRLCVVDQKAKIERERQMMRERRQLQSDRDKDRQDRDRKDRDGQDRDGKDWERKDRDRKQAGTREKQREEQRKSSSAENMSHSKRPKKR